MQYSAFCFLATVKSELDISIDNNAGLLELNRGYLFYRYFFVTLKSLSKECKCPFRFILSAELVSSSRPLCPFAFKITSLAASIAYSSYFFQSLSKVI